MTQPLEPSAGAAPAAPDAEALRRIVENVPQLLWLFDVPTCRFIYLGPAYEEIWGCSREAAYADAHGLIDTVHPDDRAARYRAYDRQVAGETTDEEFRIVSPDGEVRWLRCRAQPVRDPAGQVVQIAGFGADITAHKQSAELLALRVRQQAAVAELGRRALAESALLPVMEAACRVVADTLAVEHSLVLECVRGGETLLIRAGVGWQPGQVGQSHVAAHVGSPAGYCLLSGQPVVIEDLDADPRFAAPPHLRAHAIKSGATVIIAGSRGPYGVLGAHTSQARAFSQDDIHFLQSVANVLGAAIERSRVEERGRLFQSLGQRLNAVASVTEAGEIVLEVADRLCGWDACWLELWEPGNQHSTTVLLKDTIHGARVEVSPPPTKLTPTSMMGRCIREGPLLHLRRPEELKTPSRPFGDRGRPSASLMFVPIHSRGEIVGVVSIQSYTCNAYTREDLEGLQALADYCGDALERTHGQQVRQQLEEQLRQSQKMEAIGRLAGGVAHDFNNMLAVINGYCSLLNTMLPAESPITEPVREITRAGERAAALTRQLLVFSRKQLLETRVLDLAELVRGLNRMLRRLIGEDIELKTLLPGQPCWVRADPTQLEQVLMNLVLNARDAMPRGGRLTLQVEPQSVLSGEAAGFPDMASGEYALLTVADTGCGMPPEVLCRIFDPFFTTKPAGQGTGLGLATVYGIVRQSAGQISVESRPGAGTTFSVFLPLTPAEPDAEPPRAEPEVAGGTEVILLVEDEEMVRRLTTQILADQGYQVLEARHGEAALELAAAYTGAIDLLLTDVVMPGLGGRALAEELRRLRPGLKVLYMSGYTDDAVLRHGISHAEVAFLRKPFRPQELRRHVRTLLDTP